MMRIREDDPPPRYFMGTAHMTSLSRLNVSSIESDQFDSLSGLIVLSKQETLNYAQKNPFRFFYSGS